MNSYFHGPEALRRRLYTFALSPEVVAAAERAGTEVPAPPVPIPFGERRILADALVPSEIIDEYNALPFCRRPTEPSARKPKDKKKAGLASPSRSSGASHSGQAKGKHPREKTMAA